MTKLKRLMVALVVGMVALPATTNAFATDVDLGTASAFAVLAASTVTNTGPSVVTGDLGVYSGTAVTGFLPGVVIGGTHAGDAAAQQAQVDLGIAYDTAAGQDADASMAGDLQGMTMSPGVYRSSSSIDLTGTLTLDAAGDPDALWIFQMGSTLTTASDSVVTLINSAQSCNVIWQVGSSATLGTTSVFKGTIMADQSITLTNGATLNGRALARIGAVTLAGNNVVMPTP